MWSAEASLRFPIRVNTKAEARPPHSMSEREEALAFAGSDEDELRAGVVEPVDGVELRVLAVVEALLELGWEGGGEGDVHLQVVEELLREVGWLHESPQRRVGVGDGEDVVR